MPSGSQGDNFTGKVMPDACGFVGQCILFFDPDRSGSGSCLNGVPLDSMFAASFYRLLFDWHALDIYPEFRIGQLLVDLNIR